MQIDASSIGPVLAKCPGLYAKSHVTARFSALRLSSVAISNLQISRAFEIIASHVWALTLRGSRINKYFTLLQESNLMTVLSGAPSAIH